MGNWLFHIQADEVIHESNLPTIQRAMQQADPDPRIDGFLFDFLNFYDSYDYVNRTRSQHFREIRICRRSRGVFSYRDSQGFRKYPNP